MYQSTPARTWAGTQHRNMPSSSSLRNHGDSDAFSHMMTSFPPPLLLLRQSSVRFGRGRKFGDTYQSSSVPSSPLMTRLELLLTPSLPSPPLPSPALFPWIQSRIHHHQPPASGNSRPMRDTIIFNSRPGDPLSFANRYFN